MTEEEWLDSTNPQKMLEMLQFDGSARKMRLFAVACCRAVWASMVEERSRRAVEVAERFAEGSASEADMEEAFAGAYHAEDNFAAQAALAAASPDWSQRLRPEAGGSTQLFEHAQRRVRQSPFGSATMAACSAALAFARRSDAWRVCHFVRDIFSPFCPALLEPTWLTPAVVYLAQAAYEVRSLPSGELALDGLAVLADALEEAGCTNADILTHLRSAGPHVRGCWALDLVLGKQ